MCSYLECSLFCSSFVTEYIQPTAGHNIVRLVKSRRIRWAGHVARTGEQRGVCRVLVEKPEGKRPLRRPRLRWECNVRMDLQEVGCGVWTGLDWLRIETGGGQL
jgi:hypothetical protein